MEVWEYRAEFPAPLPVSAAVRQDGRRGCCCCCRFVSDPGELELTRGRACSRSLKMLCHAFTPRMTFSDHLLRCMDCWLPSQPVILSESLSSITLFTSDLIPQFCFVFYQRSTSRLLHLILRRLDMLRRVHSAPASPSAVIVPPPQLFIRSSARLTMGALGHFCIGNYF